MFEKIEDYLNGRLNPEELTAFEIKMSKEDDLKEEVEIQRLLLRSVDAGSLKQSLDGIHDEVYIDSSQKKGRNMSNWKIAAGIALILGIGAMLFNNESKEDTLFAEYRTQDPGLPVPMSTTDSYEFYDAMVNYKEEKFDLAISKWKHLQLSESSNDTLNYFIGSAQFNAGHFSPAIDNFKSVLVKGNGEFEQKSMWYLALSYLKTGQEQELLSLKPAQGSKFKDRIEEIQARIKE